MATNYSDLFTKKTSRRQQTAQLLKQIETAVRTDLDTIIKIASESIQEAYLELIDLNLKFYELFMKVRWSTEFSNNADVRFELQDIQKVIDSTRADFRTLASLEMNERNNAM
jgi:hypothetical protein